MLAEGFIGQRVELPRFCISLDLAIPCSAVKLGEPLPKLCEFLSRESGDSLLEGFDFTHTGEDTNFSYRGLIALAPKTSESLRSSRGGLRLLAPLGFDRRHHF